MKYYSDVATDKYGNALSGVLVTVKRGGASATIYSDSSGSAASNPLTTDQDGGFSFWYSTSGKYTFEVNGAQVGQQTLVDNSVTPEDFWLNVYSDWTTPIQNALNTIGVTSNGVRFNPATTYAISDTLTLSSKSRFQIWGAGKITQATANKPIFSLTSCSDFEIHGLHLYGLGTDFNPSSDVCLGDGITLTGCSDFAVHHNTFKNFGYTGVRAKSACFNFSITDNRIYGTNGITTTINNGDNYQFGVIVQSGASLLSPCLDFEVSRNRITGTAFGIRVEPGSMGYEIHQNVIYSIPGQHGMYLNGTNLSVNGNTLRSISKVGIKLQAFQVNGIAFTEGINNATVIGNTISAAETGISVEKTGSLAPNTSNVTVSGNTMTGITSAGYGLNLQDVIGMVVDGNTISGGAHGIIATVITSGYGCQGRITNNSISDTQWAAISGYSYLSLVIEGNTAIRPCLAAAVSTDAQKAAFYVSTSASANRARVSGNTLVTDTSTGVVNGLFAATVGLDLGDNDFEAKPISTSSVTMRKRTMHGDYEGASVVSGIGPIATGAKLLKTITVSGVVVTDRVVNASIASDLQGCSLTAYCTTDTLNLVFTNNTGGSVTVADGFVRYSIMRYAA